MTGETTTMLLYGTAPSEDVACEIANTLVAAGCAACVNIIPAMKSVYCWKGEVQLESECAMIIKTASSQVSRLVETFVQCHPYDVPAIVALPVAAGHPDFLEWIRDQTERGPHAG